MRDCVLAIDVGTGSVKAAVVDAGGEMIWRGARAQALAAARPGWAEQDPEEWWRLSCELLQHAPAAARARVASICVTAHNPTLVCLGLDGVPRRPAITWADGRAASEARTLSAGLGRPVDPAMLVPKAMWLAKHEPEALRGTRLLQGFDYLAYRLTGNMYALSAVPGWPAWDAAQVEQAGLDPSLLPPPGPPMGALIGGVRAGTADVMGLPAETPVIAGLVDGLAAWIGTATLEPGELYAGGGTTAGANLCWPSRLESPDQRIFSLPHPLGRRFMPGGPMSSGSRFLEWLAQAVCRTDIETLIREAGAIPPGAEGLLALPYLSGERTPIADSYARAAFVGLDNRHSRGHLARAAMEAVAFALRDVMDVLLSLGGDVRAVRVGGGGSVSDTWNQIKADVLRRPVNVPVVRDSSLMGAAVIAAWGARLHPSGDEAARAMVHSSRVIEPGAGDIYDKMFDLYRVTYRELRPGFVSLRQMAGAA